MRVHVEFETEVPDNVYFRDVSEWIRYNLNAGEIKVSNDLVNKDLEAQNIFCKFD